MCNLSNNQCKSLKYKKHEKLLGLALVATLVLVSCKKETNDKVEDATEAIKQKWVRL
jgi:hypothetical protein